MTDIEFVQNLGIGITDIECVQNIGIGMTEIEFVQNIGIGIICYVLIIIIAESVR
jgi:hypothetical protein